MSEPLFVKGAADLFLDAVAKYLEEALSSDPPGPVDRLWHAVLYLQRAIKAMREEKQDLFTVVIRCIQEELDAKKNAPDPLRGQDVEQGPGQVP